VKGRRRRKRRRRRREYSVWRENSSNRSKDHYRTNETPGSGCCPCRCPYANQFELKERGGRREKKKKGQKWTTRGRLMTTASWCIVMTFPTHIKKHFLFPPFRFSYMTLVYIFTPFLPWRLSDIRMETNGEKQQHFYLLFFVVVQNVRLVRRLLHLGGDEMHHERMWKEMRKTKKKKSPKTPPPRLLLEPARSPNYARLRRGEPPSPYSGAKQGGHLRTL
jgi:hypothetical protein